MSNAGRRATERRALPNWKHPTAGTLLVGCKLQLAVGGWIRLSAGVNLAVEHIGIAARDPGALKDWCMRVLEAELVFADGKTPPAFFVRLGGGVLLEIYASTLSVEETGNNRLAGWRHMALCVDFIEAARDVLIKRGVEFEPLIKPAGGGGRVLFFKDPEGNLWHLVERPLGLSWGCPASAP